MEWAAKYIGLPYAENGRGPGFDCWGLVKRVLREEFNQTVPDFTDRYAGGRDPAITHLCAEESLRWAPVKKGEERPGDVVLLKIAGRPWHVGLVVARGLMLHVARGIDACLERFDGPVWGERLEGIYRRT
jgi:cell wall-associated NlpC family hydrolase